MDGFQGARREADHKRVHGHAEGNQENFKERHKSFRIISDYVMRVDWE